MQITIDSSALVDAVAWAQKSISARPTQPILSGVMLTADAGTLTVSGFNHESASTATLAADVDAPGTCLLPATIFAGIIKSLPRGKALRLDVTDRALIRCGTAKFTTQTMPMDDYPALPGMPERLGTVSGDVFATASSQVTYAASNDDGLPILTAVNMLAHDRLSLMATDRYRLTFATVDWVRDGGAELSMLVPAGVIDNVARMNAGEVEVFGNDTQAAFRCGTRTTVTNLVAGEYPKIMSLFPEHCPTTALVSVPELLEVLGRASNITEAKQAVRLTFTESDLTVESGSSNGATGMETITAETSSDDGDVIVCGFNVHYLIAALRTLTTPNVEFGFQVDTRKPALIREPGAGDAKQLCMPVRLDATV